jgi:hypothetical protein
MITMKTKLAYPDWTPGMVRHYSRKLDHDKAVRMRKGPTADPRFARHQCRARLHQLIIDLNCPVYPSHS